MYLSTHNFSWYFRPLLIYLPPESLIPAFLPTPPNLLVSIYAQKKEMALVVISMKRAGFSSA